MKEVASSPTEELKTALQHELEQIYPDMKSYLAKRYASKYVEEVLEQLRVGLSYRANPLWENQIGIYKENFNTQVRSNGTRVFLIDFMDRSTRTKLIDITHRGYPGQTTKVQINPLYETLAKEALLEEQPSTPQTRALSRGDLRIPVTSMGLQLYIQRSRDDLSTIKRKSSPLYLKIERNLFAAQHLVSQIHTDKQGEYLLEQWETKDTGRRYGLNRSLQNQSSQVRHAALGACVRYDFKAASFAVTASLAQQIAHATGDTVRTASLEDYVRNRQRIRERIARDTGCRIQDIKQAFTALGFGAQQTVNPYKALGKIFRGHPEDYAALVANREWQWIFEELQQANQLLLRTFTGEFEGANGFHFREVHPESGKPRTDSQRLAWIYQNLESYMLSIFIKSVREQTGEEPLLEVHDCVYYPKQIPAEAVKDAVLEVREVIQFAEMESELVYPLRPQAEYHQPQEHDVAAMEHEQRIQAEEQRARGYASEWIDPEQGVIQPSIRDIAWEIQRARILSSPDYEYEYELGEEDQHGSNKYY